MKLSENWLRELTGLDVPRDELLDRMTMSGLEVEDVAVLGASLDGIVVAEIVECAPHPDADRLRVCRVDAGRGDRLTIVCGAPNARAGLKAPLATIGTVLPGGLRIEAATLRGVASNGMLCSARELHLEEDAAGLMELPADAPVGTSLAQYLGLPDASIEIKLTPDRADCLGMTGLAYAVAAQFGREASPPPVGRVPAQSADRVEVRLEAGADCPRYCGRVIRGIDTQAKTPLWMRERLRRSGLRPISPLVDVTNYVMLELGQPLHAFDRDALQGEVRVRRARAGETLRLLDERTVELDEDVLVIADGEGPVALAGVMGGWDTRCTDTTHHVFLEAAHFAPRAISGRARRFGLHTDASHRFERGVDPELPRQAVERATELLVRIAGGEPGPVTEAVLEEHLPRQPHVRLRRARLARVLGLEIPDAQVERILGGLGMAVVTQPDGWTVTPPSRRFDVAIEEDLIEEVARVHGYDRIPTHAPRGEVRLAPLPEGRVTESALRRQLVARGYTEALSYAFVEAGLLQRWSLERDAVALANPLSAELGVMRTALLPGLGDALVRNLARQHTRVRLFEIGRVFRATDAAPRETLRLAGVACGAAHREQWGESERAVDFHDVKGDLESLLALTGDAASFRFEPETDVPWLHPGRSAAVVRDGRHIGVIGHLHPRLAAALDIGQETVAFELDMEPLVARTVPRVGALSRFPSIRRDLAVVVADDVRWADIESTLRRTLGTRLRDAFIFDVYRGPGLESGSKSLAMGLILQDVSRTLTDRDADQASAEAVAALTGEHGARLRG